MGNVSISTRIIASIVKDLKLAVSSGMFSADFIGPGYEYYSGGRCHSRVLGIIVKALHRLDYYVDIERAISFQTPKKKGTRKITRFRPDITVVDSTDRIIGIIEYESIDATEEHLMKKIDYFRCSIPANDQIKFIVFFPTLTSLSDSPQLWIEQDRSKYIPQIKDAIQKLSLSFPEIEFCFAYLNENGFFSFLIMKGKIMPREKCNIFKRGK